MDRSTSAISGIPEPKKSLIFAQNLRNLSEVPQPSYKEGVKMPTSDEAKNPVSKRPIRATRVKKKDISQESSYNEPTKVALKRKSKPIAKSLNVKP